MFIFRFILAAISAILLFTALMVANLLQVLSLVLAPFSRHAFRRANRTIAHCWWGMCVLWAQRVHKVLPVFSGDEIPERENALVVANHQAIPDIVMLMMLAWPKKRLGDMKWFVKDVIKYVPGVGWGMLFLDCVFLKREWDRDEKNIHATFAKFQRDRIPLWLLSFPEGTRIKPSKLAKAREFAKKAGRPEPRHVLIPRTRGFASSVVGLEGQIRAVYDVTIGYPGETAPSIWKMLNQYDVRYHAHVRRYPIEDLPTDVAGLSDWLLRRFEEKDAQLKSFHEIGKFE